MRIILLSILFCFTAGLTKAQSDIKITYDKNEELYLNDLKINRSTDFEDVIKILGEPEIYKEYESTGKIMYNFNDHGISVHATNGKVSFFGVNFNWDGDKRFPEKSFEGVLKIGELIIDKKSNEDIIGQIKAVELFCPIPAMCMTKDKTVKTLILIGFENTLITQIGFESTK